MTEQSNIIPAFFGLYSRLCIGLDKATGAVKHLFAAIPVPTRASQDEKPSASVKMPADTLLVVARGGQGKILAASMLDAGAKLISACNILDSGAPLGKGRRVSAQDEQDAKFYWKKALEQAKMTETQLVAECEQFILAAAPPKVSPLVEVRLQSDHEFTTRVSMSDEKNINAVLDAFPNTVAYTTDETGAEQEVPLIEAVKEYRRKTEQAKNAKLLDKYLSQKEELEAKIAAAQKANVA